jgi:hypothetical protein
MLGFIQSAPLSGEPISIQRWRFFIAKGHDDKKNDKNQGIKWRWVAEAAANDDFTALCGTVRAGVPA